MNSDQFLAVSRGCLCAYLGAVACLIGPLVFFPPYDHLPLIAVAVVLYGAHAAIKLTLFTLSAWFVIGWRPRRMPWCVAPIVGVAMMLGVRHYLTLKLPVTLFSGLVIGVAFWLGSVGWHRSVLADTFGKAAS